MVLQLTIKFRRRQTTKLLRWNKERSTMTETLSLNPISLSRKIKSIVILTLPKVKIVYNLVEKSSNLSMPST